MKIIVLVLMSFSILAVCRNVDGQRKPQESHSADLPAAVTMLAHLKTQADEAREAGHIDEEINYRQQLSQKAWETLAIDPTSLDKYQRYNMIFLNDMPLGLLLEGTHQWPDAEVIFRHNEAELAANSVAGNDIKSENQLRLAYLLASKGKTEDAKNICSHWKGRMRHFAAGQDTAHR